MGDRQRGSYLNPHWREAGLWGGRLVGQSTLPEPVCPSCTGKHWSCVQRFATGLGCSLREAQAGETEEAETVSAMALLSMGAEQAQAVASQEHSSR